MKNFNSKMFLTTTLAVVVGLVAFHFGKKQLDQMKTTPPAMKEQS